MIKKIIQISMVSGMVLAAVVSVQAQDIASKTNTDSLAVNVGNTICPISGEKVGQEGMQPATYEYEGKIYNFCCPMCIETFKKDPQACIKKVQEELKAKTSDTKE